VGGLVSTGFTEANTSGHYEWFYAAYPDGFEGRVDFTLSGAPTVNLATAAVNGADFGISSAASAASIATAVWASGTRTLTSFGTLVADVATAVWTAGTRTLTVALALTPADLAAIAAAVWAYVTRTLTMTAAQIAAAVEGDAITIHRGDTLAAAVTGLGNITGRTKLWFTVKESLEDADAAAILQIEESAGLIYLKGAAATAGQGSLVVTNATTGALTVNLAAVASATLEPETLFYDFQWKDAGGLIHTLSEGRVLVEPDVTQAVA